MSSTSVEKFQNEKKPKKKYHKFKANCDKNTTSVPAVTDIVSQTDKVEKSPSEFVDLKDFPELTVSCRQERKTFSEKHTSSSRFKNNKSWMSVVAGGNNKLSTAFPALSSAKNLKKDEISLSVGKDVEAQTALVNTISENIVGTEKQQNANQKPGKGGSKKTPVQPQRNPNKKKRSDPLFINFQDILSTENINQVTDSRSLINKIQKKTRQPNRNRVQRLRGKELLSGNFLDSSNPTRSRGKHREIKKRKLTNLKTTIIKERILKTKIREQAIIAKFGSTSVNLLDNIDFNAEINIYLSDLNDRKLKNSERKKNKLNENNNLEKIKKEKQKENLTTEVVEKSVGNLEKTVSYTKVKQIPQTTADGEIKFSSKFREYCDNIITSDLNSSVSEFIEELIKLQDRIFLRDPIKAKAKRRHVSGIREVRKYLTLKKVKMIIIAPNLEKLQMEGSIYDSINELKSIADSQSVPYGFALDRYKLGKCTRKNVPVSAFAVMNYDGIESLYEKVLHQLVEAKRKFAEMAKPKVVEKTEDVNSKVLSTLVAAFEEGLQVSKESQPDAD